MRTVWVKDASVLAEIDRRKIDVEIRDNKFIKGVALFIDGKKIIGFDIKDGILLDDKDAYSISNPYFLIKNRDCKEHGGVLRRGKCVVRRR